MIFCFHITPIGGTKAKRLRVAFWEKQKSGKIVHDKKKSHSVPREQQWQWVIYKHKSEVCGQAESKDEMTEIKSQIYWEQSLSDGS